MMNQTTAAAIKPIPARLPTMPPAMAPALEPPPPPPPPPVLVGVLDEVVPVLVPVWIELDDVETGMVDTGGFTAVDSGWSVKV